MLKIAICDDNKNMLDMTYEIIRQSLENNNQEFQLEKFESGAGLLHEKQYQLYDIIFLDIDMPVISGFDVAKKIREDCYNIYIIFLTSYAEYMQDSFNYQPFFYILKDDETLLKQTISNTLKKIIKRMLQNEKVILEGDACKKCAVHVCDILYMEVNQHYLDYFILYMPDAIKMRGSMNECQEKYSSYGFVRIHKKYLVNLRHIDYVDLKKDEVLLYNKQKLPMSRNYKKDVDEKYTVYLRGKI